MKETVYRVDKMDCPTEEQLIRKRLEGREGVQELKFNLIERKLTVIHTLEETALDKELDALGLGATRKAGAGSGAAPASRAALWWALSLSGVTAVASEITAWTTGQEQSWPVVFLAVFSMVAGGRDTLRKGLVALRNLTPNINLLMCVAVLGASCIGQWPEAAMVTFLFGLAELIESLALDRARNAIRSLMELAPETAFVRVEDQWKEVPAGEVEVGAVVRIRPGERIPLDGRVVRGQSAVDQAPVTGESMPVDKTEGDTVFAGSINQQGGLEVEVTAKRGNTTLDRIIKAVQEAQAERAPTQRFIDAFARYYTPSVIVLAILVAALPPLIWAQPVYPWIYRALVLLVIACPCALVISTPVTVVSGLAAAARLGILVKGGVYLEEGRKLSVVALDKTGTLTHGKPSLTDVIPLHQETRERVLNLAGSLDAGSEHPVAHAIVTAHRDEPGSTLLEVDDFEAVVGRGVKGRIDGNAYWLGNHRLTEENGVCSPEVEKELKALEGQGKTAVVLTNDKQALAVLGVADTLRETSVEAVRELHELGVKTLMLTGDNSTTARAIASQVGIDDARGDLLPDDKLRIVTELRKAGQSVGMVGDGINDAPALAQSSIGFAMGAAGTDTALETADVALMQDDLRRLPLFIRLSHRTASVLKQNIAFSLFVKVLVFVLALAGKATLWMAVFADLGASLIVVANGLRLLRHQASS